MSTALTRARQNVTVQMSTVPVAMAPDLPPTVCIVGLLPSDATPLGAVYPKSLLRNTRFTGGDFYVEHLRIQGRDSLDGLPGLDPVVPSRVRDSVAVALNAGAPFVDLVMARVEGLMPWDLDRPELVGAFDPFLAHMFGTCLVMPDAGGPVPVGSRGFESEEIRTARLCRTLRLHGPGLAERFQIGLFDPVVGWSSDLEAVSAAFGSDIAICRWRGDRDALRAHGWRSAAATIAGIVGANESQVSWGLAGQIAQLPGGRRIVQDRESRLTIGWDVIPEFQPEVEYIDLSVDLSGRVRVLTEGSLRRPLGDWSIPALRTAKAIHWRIMQAAGQFVFEGARDGQSHALALAVAQSVSPFSQLGVLVGPDGSGEPVITGSVERRPGETQMLVEIGAVLRPWSRNVNVRVSLRPGAQPTFEEAA